MTWPSQQEQREPAWRDQQWRSASRPRGGQGHGGHSGNDWGSQAYRRGQSARRMERAEQRTADLEQARRQIQEATAASLAARIHGQQQQLQAMSPKSRQQGEGVGPGLSAAFLQGVGAGSSRTVQPTQPQPASAVAVREATVKAAISSPQWRRTAEMRKNAVAIKNLRSMIADTRDEGEQQVLQTLLDAKVAKARSSKEPQIRLEEATEAAAEALLRKQRADRHLDEAHQNAKKAEAAHQAALQELESARQAILGGSPRRPVQSPSKAYKHAAQMVEQLAAMGTVHGEQVALPAAALQELLARLADRSAWTPDRVVTPSWRGHSSRLGTPADQRAQQPQQAQHAQQESAGQAAAPTDQGDTAAEQCDLWTADQDCEFEQDLCMSPCSSGDGELFHIDSGEDMALQRNLRTRLHPTLGRRSSKKGAHRTLEFSPSPAVQRTIMKRAGANFTAASNRPSTTSGACASHR